jgi:uncharacterized membrane protein YfcA
MLGGESFELLAAVATFAGASVQSASGLGFSLVVAPALLAVFPAEEAMVLLLILSLSLSTLILLVERRNRAIPWPVLAPVLVAAAPGLVAGAAVVTAVPKSSLQLGVGIVVIVAGLQLAEAARMGGERSLRRAALPGRFSGAVVGLASGALTTSTGLNGPPIAVWLAGRGSTPVEIRDSLQVCFLLLSIGGLVAIVLLAGAQSSLGGAEALLLLLPLVAVGQFVGRLIFGRLDPRRYQHALIALIVLTGVASVVSGVETG